MGDCRCNYSYNGLAAYGVISGRSSWPERCPGCWVFRVRRGILLSSQWSGLGVSDWLLIGRGPHQLVTADARATTSGSIPRHQPPCRGGPFSYLATISAHGSPDYPSSPPSRWRPFRVCVATARQGCGSYFGTRRLAGAGAPDSWVGATRGVAPLLQVVSADDDRGQATEFACTSQKRVAAPLASGPRATSSQRQHLSVMREE